MRAAPVALLAALLLTGCFAASMDTAPVALPTAGSLDFRPVLVPFATCNAIVRSACFEPTVAVDASDRIYVTTVRDGVIAMSEDEGTTFRTLPSPPMPTGEPPHSESDALVQSGPDGRIWYTAFVRMSPGRAGVQVGEFPRTGIHVAATGDAGVTWEPNVLVVDEPEVDRQWLGFLPDGTPLAMWRRYEPDRVSTWASTLDGEPFLVSPGVVSVPATARHALLAPLERGWITILEIEKGSAQEAASPNVFSSRFSVMAASSTGAVALAVNDIHAGTPMLVHSPDGRTWSAPIRLEPERTEPVVAPWVTGSPRGWTTAYYLLDTPDRASLHVTRLAPDNASLSRATLASGLPYTDPEDASDHVDTHFPHLAHLSDGRVVAVWMDQGVRMAIER